MVRIRPAEAADAHAVAQVRAQTWLTAYAGVIPDQVLAELTTPEAVCREAHWRAEHSMDGVLIAVLIITSGRPRFLIPPQGRRVAGPQGGAVAAAPARNVKSRPATAPKATRGVSAAPSEDELLERATGRPGPGGAKGARRLRKSIKEISLTVPMPPKQAVARTRQIIDDLGSVASQDRGAAGSLQVIGVVGAGARDMNPAVVTVTINRSGEGSSVVVRGAAKQGLIKQRAGQDAAKRVAAELGAPQAD